MIHARGLGTLFLAGCLGGCGWWPHPPLGTAGDAGGTLIHIRPAYAVQSTVQRWRAADIHQIELTLRVWTGTRFEALNPPATVTLPQQGSPRLSARFHHLKQGRRYQVTALAWGNHGGTAAERVLNAQTPATAEFDLETEQDVPSQVAQTVSLALDPIPFTGRAVLAPHAPPAGTERYALTLTDADSGHTLYTTSYTAAETMTLLNLRAGPRYLVRLAAMGAAGVLGEALSEELHFNPTALDLEQDAHLALAFPRLLAD